MSAFKYLITLLVLVQFGDMYPRRLEEHYCQVHGINIREGEAVSIPGHCKTVKCIKASTGKITNLGCNMFILRPGCPSTETNYSMSFPSCCPHSLCQ